MIDTTPQASRSGPDTNQVFSALSNPRRRIVLQVLERESSLALAELATHVARLESETGEITDADVERVRLDLYHCHLPRLVDAGFLEYANDSDTAGLRVDSTAEIPCRFSVAE